MSILDSVKKESRKKKVRKSDRVYWYEEDWFIRVRNKLEKIVGEKVGIIECVKTVFKLVEEN